MVKASFLKIFAKSPIKPMQQHVAIVQQCVSALVPFFEGVLAGDWRKVKTNYDLIADLEGQADQLKKEIRLHLPNRLLLPIDRADFVGILKSQDQIANTAKKLSGLVYARSMVFPGEIADRLLDFVCLGVSATNLTENIINEIDQLIETGFSGAEAQLVENIIIELEDIEKNTDVIQGELRSKLFKIENDLPPIHVIFIYKAIDAIAELADKAQQVGHRLEPLLTTK